MIDRAEIKKQLHCARANLAYRKKHASPEIVAATQAEVDRLAELYADSDPARCTLRVRSPYFIGPRRAKGVRGDGPTITCFRCSEVKPFYEFYEKGTICKRCTVNRSSKWAENNPERVTQAKRESSRRKRESDPSYRAFINCRNRLNKIMRGVNKKRGSHFSELTGITARGLATHIESQFTEGMNWSNYGIGEGKWVVDHITPARFFDHEIECELKKCWHYTNLRPMWYKENLDKSDWLPCGKRARHVKKILLTY